MMFKYLWIIVMTSTLWTICLSQNACTSTISNTSKITFTCPPNVTINELPLSSYTAAELANITSIEVNGINDTTSGPFTSIPPNICLLPNLQTIDFSFNRINQVDPSGGVSRCLSNVVTLDLSYNIISEFPSFMIYNMPRLENVYFHHNRLIEVPSNAFFDLSNLATIDFSYNSLTTFELWTFLARTSVDFSYNQISTITNKNSFPLPSVERSIDRIIRLTGNSPTINLTDAVFEMYNSCDEVINELDFPGPAVNPNPSLLMTLSLANMNLGTSQINCNCDQSYILQMFQVIAGTLESMTPYQIYNATCANGGRFLSSFCIPNNTFAAYERNSSVDFARVHPRLCKIFQDEPGDLTTPVNISSPTLNASTYPYYETRQMNPGVCYFAFSSSSTVRIQCTSDVSSSSTIPSTLLATSYFSNITTIDFGTTISSLPRYFCSLPSREINLSYQAFTTLTNETFPCLDSFTKVTLAHNNLATVNMPTGNFTNLAYLDLSSNRLTRIPYSILNPTPSSLRYLDLRNNSIVSIDLFLYTLKNITVDLRENPLNNSGMIINPLNVTLPTMNSSNSSVIIIPPTSTSNSTYIFNDQTALTAGTCTRDAVLAYRNIIRMVYGDVVLDCSCASINLKGIFQRMGLSITSSFNCSSGTTAANFATLTMSSCASTALNFTNGLCYNESLQTSTNDTTMEYLSTTVQIPSTDLTTLINSSISSNVTENQQYTSLPGFTETGSNSYTLSITNSSSQLITNDTDITTITTTITTTTTTSTENSSGIVVTSVSLANNSDQMVSELFTSSSSSTLSSINATAMATSNTDLSMSIGWTTTTTTTTTSTSSTTTSRTTSTTSTSTTSRTTSTSSSTSSTSTSTSTTTTSATTTSTTTSTTSTTATTTSTTTSSTSTSRTTSSTSSSSSSSSSTSTTDTSTTSTSSATTTTVTNATEAGLQSSNRSDSSSSRTGLIVGLVLGLVGFFALIGGVIAAVVISKSKSSRSANKSVGRAVAISQAPQDALLQSHLQTRNLRAVRLAPLTNQPSQLPPAAFGTGGPVTIARTPSAKGIPIRFDAIRSPTNVVPHYVSNGPSPNNSIDFQSANDSLVNQPILPQLQEPRPRRPRLDQMLNAGGGSRY